MPQNQKKILLKVSGEIFSTNRTQSQNTYESIITELKKLKNEYSFSFVIGGGNFFRGAKEGKQLNLPNKESDEIGMLATLLNAKILRSKLTQNNIKSTILSSIYCPQYSTPISQETIEKALEGKNLIIFAGGTGNPYFSTDTNAVIRALQIGASEVWKLTKVDGIYEEDPLKNPSAKLIKKLSYQEALNKKIAVVDTTAIILAEKENLKIRVFNFETPNCLEKANKDNSFGSQISF